MSDTNTAVFGIIPDGTAAEHTVDLLIEGGVPDADISILMRCTHPPGEPVDPRALVLACGGALIASGPVMAALSALGTGSAPGSLVGGLVFLGVPEQEALRYEGRVNGGSTLLSVHSGTRGAALRAKEILLVAGVEDIASTSEGSRA